MTVGCDTGRREGGEARGRNARGTAHHVLPFLGWCLASRVSPAGQSRAAPQRSGGSPRKLGEGSTDGSIGARISEGQGSLKERYEANGTRFGERRQEFDEGRSASGDAEDRFNERFYDRDQR